MGIVAYAEGDEITFNYLDSDGVCVAEEIIGERVSSEAAAAAAKAANPSSADEGAQGAAGATGGDAAAAAGADAAGSEAAA